LFVIPSFPLPPGSGDSDEGPEVGEDSGFWDNALELLLAIYAWAEYLGQVMIWPTALVAGIVAGTFTYPLRAVLYEYLELPLYNLWLAIHTYRAMTGYVLPMPGEINSGLTTLGASVADGWAAVVAALDDPDGGLISGTAILSGDPSGQPKTPFPKDVLLDPPTLMTQILSGTSSDRQGPPPVNGQLPSEFTRPWRFPELDNEEDVVNTELPASVAGPFVAGMDANALFAEMPGSEIAHERFQSARNEAETIRAATTLLPRGLHLGGPLDYTAYIVAQLTRANLPLEDVVNFNLDSDRGYAYLCWDWLRNRNRRSTPFAFEGDGDPSQGGAPTPVSEHEYRTPLQPGYGWQPSDDHGPVALQSFNPDDPTASVRIRYINRERKFE
jgi:hypothetical protein